MKFPLIAGCALVSAIALSGCSSLGTIGIPGTAAPSAQGDQLLNTLTAFNAALAQNCNGNFAITWSPPLPPTGSASLNCQAKPAPAPIMVPLSQVQSLIPAAPATAAPK